MSTSPDQFEFDHSADSGSNTDPSRLLSPEETGDAGIPTPPPYDPDATLLSHQTTSLQSFGKFRLVKLIAQGGMGAVHRAQELAPDSHTGEFKVVRTVALKRILRERVQSPEAIERFLREIKSAKKLDHPGIVPVYESGTVNGEHYFTMPFVTGGNLQQYVSPDPAKRLTIRQAVRLIASVAEAVQYAHDQGIIHRDIKPQNIVLQPNTASSGEVEAGHSRLNVTARLTDFGLARVVAEESSLSLSQKGEAMGTPGYMPPEQATGDLDAIGWHSDVYSLGAVLYALVTGKAPFPLAPTNAVLEILRQVTQLDAHRPREINPEVPAELEDVILKCLEKEPHRRYRTARELAEALDDVLNQRSRIRHTERRSSWLARTRYRLFRSIRQHPLRAAYLIGSLLLILGLGSSLTLMTLQASRQRRTQQAQLLAQAIDMAKQAAKEERAGQRDQAIGSYRLAVERYHELFEKWPAMRDDVGLQLDLANLFLRRGALLAQDEKWKDSEEAFRSGEKILRALQTDGFIDRVRRRQLGETYHGLGTLFNAQKRREESLDFYQRALKLRQSLVQEVADDLDYQRDLARNYGFMGDVLLELCRLPEAKNAYDEAARLREAIVQQLANDPDRLLEASCQRARDFANLAAFHERMGQFDQMLQQSLQRVKYYRRSPPFSDDQPLQGEFLTDRTNARTVAADYLVDLQHHPLDEALVLLDLAEQELRILPRENSDVLSGLAFVALVRGKALVHRNKSAALSSLRTAEKRLNELPKERQASFESQYRLAVLNAWMGKLKDNPVKYGQALAYLETAIRQGYNNLPQIERERGFAELRSDAKMKQSYQQLVERLQGAAAVRQIPE